MTSLTLDSKFSVVGNKIKILGGVGFELNVLHPGRLTLSSAAKDDNCRKVGSLW